MKEFIDTVKNYQAILSIVIVLAGFIATYQTAIAKLQTVDEMEDRVQKLEMMNEVNREILQRIDKRVDKIADKLNVQ